MSEKDLEHYLHLPHRIEIYSDGGGYTAAIPVLPGCLTFGDSLQEVLDLIGDAKAGWLELAIENRQPIPEPTLPVEDHSGKFTVRLPRSLHRRLAERAKTEGISLNQLVNVTLAEAVCKAQEMPHRLLDRRPGGVTHGMKGGAQPRAALHDLPG